jgi:hypothetical protein
MTQKAGLEYKCILNNPTILGIPEKTLNIGTEDMAKRNSTTL